MTNILQMFPCKADVSCLLMACGKAQRVESWKEVGLLFRHSVVFDSLKPHGLQHARLSCPSPSPGTCSNSCPLRGWGEIIKYWGGEKQAGKKMVLKGLGEKEGGVITKGKSVPTLECCNFPQVLP